MYYSYTILRDKITIAQSNEVIDLLGETISIDSPLVISKPVTIQNGKLTGSTIFKTNNHISLTLKDLTFDNCTKTSVITGNFSNLTIDNCTFSNNLGDRSGAIFLGYGSVGTIKNSIFTKNDGDTYVTKKGFNGGAISTAGCNVLEVSNCKFTNNLGFNGGAIYALHSKVVVLNSTFEDNEATGEGGGAIFLDGYLPGGTVDSHHGGYVLIKDSNFYRNKCAGYGGAIQPYGYNSDICYIINCTITDNIAVDALKFKGRGGAIYCTANLEVIDCTILRNTASHQGGALWLQDKAIIKNTLLAQNKTLTDAGGAITGIFKTIHLTNCTIADNYAATLSGAIHYGGKKDIVFNNCIVANNKARISYGQQCVSTSLGTNNIEFPKYTTKVIKDSLVINPQLNEDYTLSSISPAINAGINTNNLGINKIATYEDTNSWIFGTNVADTLVGEENKDNILVGGYGGDTLIGGNKYNYFVGHEGIDTFVITTFYENGNTIIGFDVNKEKLDVSKIATSYEQIKLVAKGRDTIVQVLVDGEFKNLVRLANVNYLLLKPTNFVFG